MYTEEEKFRQTEATVIKSTKNSEGHEYQSKLKISEWLSRVNFISVSRANFLSYKR